VSDMKKKKIIRKNAGVLLVVIILFSVVFVSGCLDRDTYGSEDTSVVQKLIGEWKHTTLSGNVVFLVFTSQWVNSERTGYWKKYDGTIGDFTWIATTPTVFLNYDDTQRGLSIDALSNNQFKTRISYQVYVEYFGETSSTEFKSVTFYRV